jgi:methylmalonyl-CoA epimerase
VKATDLDHVGIAVTDLRAAAARWEALLGVVASLPEEVPSNGVRVRFLEAGPTHIELLEPLGPTSPIAGFLAKRGEGIHHLAFGVPNVDRVLADLQSQGQRVVDATGRPGSRGRRVGFAHPSAFGGVLVEFVESP